MATSKSESRSDTKPSSVELRAVDDEIRDPEFEHNPAKQGATEYDLRDMNALGLMPTFRRRFKFIAMVGFSSTVVVAWQNVLIILGLALLNGGTGGLFWTFVFSIIAMTFVYLTLAELSSIFPTAGGQYQWVAECAPPAGRRLISYCVGWLLVLGWQTWLSSCGVGIGNTIKWCILLYHPESAAANSQWLPTLIGVIMLICGGLFNIYCVRRFPLLESIMLFLHLAAWVAITVTLWVTSPRGHVHDVLFTFNNGGGWSSTAASVLVGVTTAWSSILGYDSSVHMTENVQDASKTVPASLMTAFVTNAALAFIFCVTIIFCAGDFEQVLSNPNLSAFVIIFNNSTQSKAATVVMIVPVLLTICSAMISQVATASRQLCVKPKGKRVAVAT